MNSTRSLTPSRHILSAALDPWLVGGLSIAVLGSFILFSSFIPQEFILSKFVVLTILLNGTHFMASYRLLYSSRESVLSYPMASIVVPAFLCAYALFAIWAVGVGITMPVEAMLMIMALYLALHYTGQAWGMMASYAFLGGIKFSPEERRQFRICLRVMAVWHMLWALIIFGRPPAWLASELGHAMSVLNAMAIVSFLWGAMLFRRMSIRLGTKIPHTVILPFLSLYVWYFFLWIFPQALFWVQLSHSLQYLAFPIRVELNRSVDGTSTLEKESSLHIVQYLIALIFTSFVVFFGIDKLINYPNGGFEAAWVVISAGINIHHYFIDGCIWHISNPVVGKQLFAHLQKSSA